MIKKLLLSFILVSTCLFLFVRAINFESNKYGKDLVWITSIEVALKLSEETKKPILANFTGSDWCGWCVKLSKEVFNQPEFKTWADKNVILLELDYPKNKIQTDAVKQQNAGLQQAFQVQSFPTIWVFNLAKDAKTNKFNITPIGKTGYVSGGPNAFIENIEKMFANFKMAKLEKTKP